MADEGEVSALVCDNGSGMVKVSRCSGRVAATKREGGRTPSLEGLAVLGAPAAQLRSGHSNEHNHT